MNPFWTSFFDSLGTRGRNAKIFLVALGGFFALSILAAIVKAIQADAYLLPLLPGLALLLFSRAMAVSRRARRQKAARAQPAPLSRDELRIARSKLLKDRL